STPARHMLPLSRGATVPLYDELWLAVGGMVAGDTEIDTAESVDVSYPGFFAQMKGLGAEVEAS
ncbi:MAG TPA: hypothetical protein PLK88_00375, partial [Methanothrix sp.]|nr:hypothetical protein [Methanothrix sp.]